MPRRRAPWWVFLVAGSYLGYFALLVYCDIRRPETPGMTVNLATDAVVSRVVPGSPADRAGLRVGDRIAAWNGRNIHDVEWMFIDANIELDRPARLDVDRNGSRRAVELTLRPAPWTYWQSQEGWMLLGVRLMQLVSLAFGLLIAIKRPFDPVARLGAWLLATFGVFCVVLPYRFAAVWRALPLIPATLLWIPYVSSLAIAAMLATFIARFPRRIPQSPRGWAIAPMALALIGPAFYMGRMVYRPDLLHPGSFHGTILVLTSFGYLVFGLTMLVVNYRRLEDVTERRRVGVIVMGLLIGCLLGGPVIPLYWLQSADDLDRTLFNSALSAGPTLVLLVIPLSFTYAILRHRLFDVSVMIRQGVRHALARRVVLSLVPGLAVALVADLAVMHRDDPIEGVFLAHLWIYVALAALAVIAHSQRQRWLDAIDHRFFRDRYDARRLLRRVAQDLRGAGSVERAAPLLVAQLESSLHAEFAALLVRRGTSAEYHVIAAAPAARTPPPIRADTKVMGIVGVLGRPLEIALPEADWLTHQLPAGEIDFLRDARIDMIVPVISARDRDNAVLALGPKRSEEPYTEEDLDLLVAIADSLALLLEGPAAASEPTETFAECPECGVCYDSGRIECGTEAARLIERAVPRVLGGRYRIERRIGRGGMGIVYLALDTALDRRVAAKVVREDFAGGPGAADRFQREARIAAAFAHPNVVTVHDFGLAGRHAFLVMELLDGQTLREALRAQPALQPARTIRILRHVAAAIDAAHRRQLVHRDLKPENIALVGRDEEEIAKVLDFGIAKLLDADTATMYASGPVFGTPLYMAPEQLRGEDPQASWDLWALAIVAYEMVTGSHPFASGSFDVARAELARGTPSESCHDLFADALAADVARRPVSARAFVDDLQQILHA